MQVRDVMTARPMTIAPETPLETAVAVMRERRRLRGAALAERRLYRTVAG